MCSHIAVRRARAVLALAALVIFATGATGVAHAAESPNLIVNGDAESGDASGSGYDAVTIPGWGLTGVPTVVRYGQHADGITGTAGALRGLTGADQFPTPATPGPPGRGKQMFVGGPVGNSTLTQTVPLGAASAIDAGTVTYTLDGWLGGNTTDASNAGVTVTFLGAQGQHLGTGAIGPVTSLQRLDLTKLIDRSATGKVPAGTRAAEVTLTMIDSVKPNAALEPYYNNSYADDLSLRLSATIAAPGPPKPPAASVGRLDHVFMVYMENEGDGDIVGSSSAPYLNSLIGRYGFATNYRAVQHPSDPNYIAFFGGATYGIDTDCALACTVNERNLADQIEAAHESWKFYEQTMPTPCDKNDFGPNPTGTASYYAPDELPWSYFADIAGNPTRCQAHVRPLPQMSTDLASAKTTPNYVWFEADDCDDMEQCGIKAGDTWLSQNLPTILNSPAFKDQRSSIFVTFDEDNNNKSFNEDNQLQQVPMIVIPSRKSGLLSGAVRSGTYYTHYGLLRTIQTALGLPTNLTLNDTYADPLNDFWPAVPVLSSLRVRRSHGVVTFHYRDSGASLTTLAIGRTPVRFTHRDHRGANTVRLPRSIRIRLSGVHTLTATPANAAGVRGAHVRVRFRP